MLIKRFTALLKAIIKILKNMLGFLRDIRNAWRYPNNRIGLKCIIGAKVSLASKVILLNNISLANVSIAYGSYVGSNCRIKNCTIGKYCSIAPDVLIGLGIHPTRDVVSTYPGFYSKASGAIHFNYDESIVEYKSISIGNDVWIGTRAMILDGVKVGDGAIIAAGSIVTKDVPDFAVVGGVPANIIRSRFSKEQIEKIKNTEWWDWSESKIQQHVNLFMNVDSFCKEKAINNQGEINEYNS